MESSYSLWLPAIIAVASLAALFAGLMTIKKGMETFFGIEIRSKTHMIAKENKEKLESLEPTVRDMRYAQQDLYKRYDVLSARTATMMEIMKRNGHDVPRGKNG